MNPVQLVWLIAGGVITFACGIFGYAVYSKEVRWPERILLRKKREGNMEVTWQRGRIVNIKDQEGNKTRKLWLQDENIKKPIDSQYTAGITTGLFGRKHNYWELYSPNSDMYNFVRTTINDDGINMNALSSNDREHLVNSQRRSMFVTQTEKDFWDKAAPFVPLASAILICLTMIIMVTVYPKAVSEQLGNRIASAIAEATSKAVGQVGEVTKNI